MGETISTFVCISSWIEFPWKYSINTQLQRTLNMYLIFQQVFLFCVQITCFLWCDTATVQNDFLPLVASCKWLLFTILFWYANVCRFGHTHHHIAIDHFGYKSGTASSFIISCARAHPTHRIAVVLRFKARLFMTVRIAFVVNSRITSRCIRLRYIGKQIEIFWKRK